MNLQEEYNIHYDNIITAKTGDVILGASEPLKLFQISFMTVLSALIQNYIFRSKFTHVGMAVVYNDQPALWEATSSIDEDLITGKSVSGCKLVCLKKRVESYLGEVWMRRLIFKDADIQISDYQAGLDEAIAKYHGKSFEKSRWQMVMAYYDGPFGKNKTDESTMFCSELLAATYQHMGFLPFPPKGLPSNEYTPLDFSAKDKGEFMDFNGIELGPEVPLKTKKQRR